MVGTTTRRRFLGSAGTVVVVSIAGCTGMGPSANDTTGESGANETGAAGTGVETGPDTSGTDGTGTGGTPAGGTLPGTDYPAVQQWLTETTVGAADGTYDGTVTDRRGITVVVVKVGARGNGGNYAFSPSAVAVSPGTTVRWVWTGEGGAHSVDAALDGQTGTSDYEFSSGEPVDGSEETFERTLDRVGVALYRCEPHVSVGMKGAVVVTE